MGIEEFLVEEGEDDLSIAQQIERHGDFWKEGRASKYDKGIVYKAPWETQHDGVCIAARRHARALRMTGVPVFLQSDSFTHSNMGVVSDVEYFSLPPVVRAEVGGITQVEHGQSLLLIRHCVPTRSALEYLAYPPVSNMLNREQISVVRKATILFAAFEANRFDEDTVRYLNMLGRVWVTCDANRKWLTDAGVDPARVVAVPHPFYGKDPMAQPRAKRSGRLRFLNVSKWEPRKAQHDLIGGFLLAFKPADDVELVLKCSPFTQSEGYPKDWQASIERWAADLKISSRWSKAQIYERVKVLWKASMTRSQLAQLYHECDVYVSTGRSEGFDLPAFDAKLAGMRLVHAQSGGPEMFHQQGVDIVIGPEDLEAQPFHPMYGAAKDATWAGFGPEHVAAALMDAYEAFRDPIPPFDRSRYTMRAVGAVMRQSCNELLMEHGLDISGVNVDAAEGP